MSTGIPKIVENTQYINFEANSEEIQALQDEIANLREELLNTQIQIAQALKKQTEFDDSGSKLQDNQTNNAILKALGLKEPGQRGRKADPNKPEKPASTGKKGRPAGSGEKKAVRTPGDDGFDKVEYVDADVEDIETTQAPAGDIEMEKAARKGDELIKQYRDVMNTYKEMKSGEGEEAAKEYLKSKQNIVKKYLAMQKVNA